MRGGYATEFTSGLLSLSHPFRCSIKFSSLLSFVGYVVLCMGGGVSCVQVAAYFEKEAIRLNLNTTQWDVSDMVWEIFEIDDRNKDGLISRREFSGPIKGSDEL